MSSVIQWGLWFLMMSVVMGALGRARLRPRAESERGDLVHPTSTLVVGVVCSGFFMLLAVLCLIFPGKDGGPLISVFFMAFSTLGLLMIAEYTRSRHRVEPEGLRYHTFMGRAGLVRWIDISRVTFSPGGQWFVVEGSAGEKVRLSTMLMGLPELARVILQQVEPDRIDPGSREIIEETAAGNPPSVWG